MSVTIGNKKYLGKSINEYGVQGMQWGTAKGRNILANRIKEFRNKSVGLVLPRRSINPIAKEMISAGKERSKLATQIKGLRKAGLVSSGRKDIKALGQHLFGYVPRKK